MGGIKSPPPSTPQRSGGEYSGSKRHGVDAVPLNFQTPPPPRDEAKAECPVDDGPPPAAQCLPCHPQWEEEMKQAIASRAGADQRRDEEKCDNTERSGGSSSPEPSGAAGAGAAAAVEPGGGRRRCDSQQMGRLTAAAAAVEAAAAAVAAIPAVSFHVCACIIELGTTKLFADRARRVSS